MRSIRNGAVLALAATTALTLAACGGSNGGAGSGGAANSGRSSVSLTWWNNATANPLKGVWASVASSYHAGHHDRTQRRRHQAEGGAHRADRRGQQGPLAGRVLVGVLRAAGLLHHRGA